MEENTILHEYVYDWNISRYGDEQLMPWMLVDNSQELESNKPQELEIDELEEPEIDELEEPEIDELEEPEIDEPDNYENVENPKTKEIDEDFLLALEWVYDSFRYGLKLKEFLKQHEIPEPVINKAFRNHRKFSQFRSWHVFANLRNIYKQA